MKRLAVLSHIVFDEVRHSVGHPATFEVGGAGAYAAVGGSLVGSDRSTLLVSGVGRTDRTWLCRWCESRGIDPVGLFNVGEQSPRTLIQYDADGERQEVPAHGLAHFDAHTPLPRHIPVAADELDSLYLFHDHEGAYWDEVCQYSTGVSGPVLWELSRDSCRPDARDAILERVSAVDVLSINETEAFALLGVTGLVDTVRLLRRFPSIVVLRLGSRGSVLVDHNSGFRVGTAPTPGLDPTGGGNSYSGAFVASFARTGDPIAASRLASAAASVVVAAPGAPEITDEMRAGVRAAASLVTVVPL